MEVSEAKRLKQLEDENAKLKKLLADQMLDAAAMRELLSSSLSGLTGATTPIAIEIAGLILPS